MSGRYDPKEVNMKLREIRITHNSYNAAYLVLDYMCEKHPDVDIDKHERNVELLLARCLGSKKKRTRKKYRRKMTEYYGYAKKNL